MSEEMVANQIAKLQESLQEAQHIILEQEDAIAQLTAAPLVYATVISSNHHVNPEAFMQGDKVLVIDPKCGSYHGRIGTIVSDGVDMDTGTVRCEFYGIRTKPHFNVGLETIIDDETGKPKEPQVHLLVKNDGSNIVICLDGKIQEVWNTYRFNPSPGDVAKCNLKTNQVEAVTEPAAVGDLCNVIEVSDQIGENKIEVESGGGKKVVYCYFQEVEVGDKVILDHGNIVVVRHIGNEETKKFKLHDEVTLTWDDIGGQEEAKQQMQEAIVLPIRNPDIFKFYHKKIPAGVLLFGPPGCGKTMIGKATAHELAALHGKQAVQSGFNYVKGPEILSMWVGESEAQSRAIFARMRKHYEMHGYPCVTFVDEADAIFTERGGQHAQKWHDTLVAMWLAEMDGFDRKGGVIILATNRPKALDGAIVREGRIDAHIKVARPNRESATQIFKIHVNGCPLADSDPDAVVNACVEEIIDNTRPLYQVTDGKGGDTHLFCLSDCISGSMIASCVEQAKTLAMRRDMSNGKKPKGIKLDDFRDSIGMLYMRHMSLNHRFDLIDFCEVKGLNEQNIKVERVSAMQ
jgi:ATP-dependent 26S proteasome regulatory subunit